MMGLARLIAWLAARLLPPGLAEWGQAMRNETRALPPRPALRFALGCLRASLACRLTSHGSDALMTFGLLNQPRRLAVACAASATLLGFAYFLAAGAPGRFFAINAGAFLLGIVVLFCLRGSSLPRVATGLFAVATAGILLSVAFVGASADGVSRWVRVGGMMIQPSLIVVPILVLAFMRLRDGLSALAIWIAALAVALQPDRAMAAVLVAGLAVIALSRRGTLELATLAVAACAFAVALIRPDPSPAGPFVDQILFTAFDAHLAAGLAVWAGLAALLVPAVIGIRRDPADRLAYNVFGAIWLTVIVAAGLGNFPTPLVGYGGSAVLGYLISIVALPPRAAALDQARSAGSARLIRPDDSQLRAALT